MLPRLGDGNMNKLIDLIERALNRLEAMQLNNFKILSPTTFVTPFANQRVFHGLGYPMTGFFVIDTTTLAQIARSTTADVDPNNYALMGSSVAATVTILVF
jgi:hypothetical protein